MSLLKDKGWIAREFYNEYLELKVEISELVKKKEYIAKYRDENVKEIEEMLEEKVSQMKFVLQQLQRRGISLEDLILLSLGVDFEVIRHASSRLQS